MGIAASAAAEFGISNANSSDELAGYSAEGGGSGGHLGDFGGAYARSLKNFDGPLSNTHSFNVTVGVGEGAEGHTYLIKTKVNGKEKGS